MLHGEHVCQIRCQMVAVGEMHWYPKVNGHNICISSTCASTNMVFDSEWKDQVGHVVSRLSSLCRFQMYPKCILSSVTRRWCYVNAGKNGQLTAAWRTMLLLLSYKSWLCYNRCVSLHAAPVTPQTHGKEWRRLSWVFPRWKECTLTSHRRLDTGTVLSLLSESEDKADKAVKQPSALG